MAVSRVSWVVLAIVAGGFVLVDGTASQAQVQRYQPNRPTVSPYLNLFQNNRNGRFNSAVPNYFSLVRPQLQQLQTNQAQQQLLQQQNQMIGQLQGNVQQLQRQQQAGQPVVLTGHSSWFGNDGQQSRFMNTSRFYSRAGTAGRNQR